MDFTFATTGIKQFAFILLVTCTVFAVHTSPTIESKWIVWSAFLLALTPRDKTPWQCMIVVLVTGLIAALFTAVAGMLVFSLPLFAGYCFIVVFVGSFGAYRAPNFAFSSLVIVMLTLLSGTMPVQMFSDNMARALYIVGAAVIVAASQSVYLIHFARESTRLWTIKAVRSIRLLSSEIFACLLETEYPINQYLFERRLHVRKVNSLHALDCLRQVAHPGHTPHRVLLKLENIFSILLDCSQLRRRITDHTVFALCKHELEAISDAVSHAFVQVAVKVKNRDVDIDVQALEKSIMRLEENYHHVLQITSREPLAFLLFINSLMALKEEIAR